MRNSADRQARSRLARRRPGPHRIRRRASGARTGWRRIPWVHVGTVAGAVAAIGTVLFTGIATYYSAKIGSDQLDQSREDAERKARSQAEQVSFYVGGEGGAEDLHIVNRSPDPIYSPGVFFRTQVFDPRGTAAPISGTTALEARATLARAQSWFSSSPASRQLTPLSNATWFSGDQRFWGWTS